MKASQQTKGLCRIILSTAKTFNVQGNKQYEIKNQGGNCSGNPLLEAQPLGGMNGYHTFDLSLIPTGLSTPAFSKSLASHQWAELIRYSKCEHTGGAGRMEKVCSKTKGDTNHYECEPAPLWDLRNLAQHELVRHKAYLLKCQKAGPCEHPLSTRSSESLSRSLAYILKHLSSVHWVLGMEFYSKQGKTSRKDRTNYLQTACHLFWNFRAQCIKKLCQRAHTLPQGVRMNRCCKRLMARREKALDKPFNRSFVRKQGLGQDDL